jgi:antitoxin component YwqK of YwqJK toxin-antitoxin module
MSGEYDPYSEWLDIPLKDQPPNYYQLLGIKLYEADPEAIKSAALRQMERVQSFRTNENSELLKDMLKKIAAARGCLLDPAGKAGYDNSLRLILQNPPEQSSAPPLRSKPPNIKKQQSQPANAKETANTPNSTKIKSHKRRQIIWLPYIGLGAVGVAAVVIVLLLVLRGSHPNSSIAAPNGHIAQAADPAEKNPPDGLARSDNADSNKTASPISEISRPAAPSLDENDSAAEKKFSNLGATEATELKQAADQPPIAAEPEKQPDSAIPEGRASSRPNNILPSDLDQVSSQQTQNTALPQPRGNRLPSRTAATSPPNGQAGLRQNSSYSSSSADNKIAFDLPSGKAFSSQLFDADIRSAEDKLKDQVGGRPGDKDDLGKVILLHSPSSKTYALAEHDKGRLDGVYLAFYDEHAPMIYANYNDGSCDGIIKKWNANGERVYWCQYIDGFRHGFCCYFKDDVLQILFEINHNKINAVHLCNNSRLEKSFKSIEQAKTDEIAKIFINEVNEVESELKDIEVAYKKQIRDEEMRFRQQKAAVLNQKRRADIQDHINQRGTQWQEQMNQQRRRAGL